MVLPESIIDLLNLMPKLEKICLEQVITPWQGIDLENSPLQLTKLQTIESSNCSILTLNIFKRLPANVLKTIQIVKLLPLRIVHFKLFVNQHEIRELKVDESSINLLDLKLIKLTTLKLCSPVSNLEAIVNVQPVIKTLIVKNLDDGELRIICNGLASLENLDLETIIRNSMEGNRIENNKYSELSKLKKLKKLEITMNRIEIPNKVLGFLKSESLTELKLRHSGSYNLSSETIVHLGASLPQLKRLYLLSYSKCEILKSVIENMKKLEELECKIEIPYADIFEIDKNLKNETLKRLSIEYSNFVAPQTLSFLFKFLGCLKSLESLSIHSNSVLSIISEDFVKSLKENGERLTSFNYYFQPDNQSIQWNSAAGEGFIIAECRELFGEIIVNEFEWLMKK